MTYTTAPGWFPDPQVPGQQRYWNGALWTEHTAPLAQPQPAGFTQARSPSTAVADTIGTHKGSWFVRHPVATGLAATFVLLVALGAALGNGSTEQKNDQSNVASADDRTSDDDEVAAADDEPTADVEPVIEPDPVDTDGDGVVDDEDFAPDDPAVKTAYDVDTDGDGVADPDDAFPDNPEFSKDSDGDGYADRIDAFPNDSAFHQDTDNDKVADAEDAFPQDPTRSEITLAMENALDAAENYLDYSAFSKQGLIGQLSSEYGSGFEVGDATWAVDQLDVSWQEQAVRSARQYLEYTSFSRQGLIDQLSSPYGSQFTVEEATYAVDQIGL